MAKTESTRDGMQIIKARFDVDPRKAPDVQSFANEYRIAQMIHDARAAAGLTQVELADAIGTTQSVISQLENADYEGHSLSMLKRIAEALGMDLEISLVPRDASHL